MIFGRGFEELLEEEKIPGNMDMPHFEKCLQHHGGLLQGEVLPALGGAELLAFLAGLCGPFGGEHKGKESLGASLGCQ